MVGKIAITRLPEITHRLSRSMNHVLNSQNNSTTVHIPGFRYDDFDRAGYVNFAKINRMGEMNRLSGHGIARAYDVGSFFTNMLGVHWTFTRQLYDRAAIDYPMVLRSRPAGVGRSTIDIGQSLEEEKTGDILANCVQRLVNIDPTSQKSVPLASTLAEKLAAGSLTGGHFPRLEPPKELPKRTFTCSIPVRRDDMDFLFHTTQGAYFGFARECAGQAVESGFYSRITDDGIAFRLARTATGVHYAESFAGDVLDVTTWEDAANPLLLHFVVRKRDQTIYYSRIEFYDE